MSTNKPTLFAYTVKNRGKRQKAIWTRIACLSVLRLICGLHGAARQTCNGQQFWRFMLALF
jgi:hypothetical protein